MEHHPRALKKLLILGILAAGVTLLPGVVHADFAGESWPYQKSIMILGNIPVESLVEVVPDREVFAGSSNRLADLRIIEQESGREVPYQLLIERGERRRGSVEVALRDLSHIPGESTSFVADIGREGVLHNEIEIRTPSRNFQRKVSVEGSSDLTTWAILEDAGQIFDFTIVERGFTERLTRVRYPSSTLRYLRVNIVDGQEPPLEVTGALAFFSEELRPQETESLAAILEREEDSAAQKTLLYLDVKSRGLPTTRLSIAIPQDNFYRRLNIDGSDDNVLWTPIQHSAAVYSFNTPRFKGGNLSVSLPEVTFRYYRLTVFNEDDAPLPITEVRFYGHLRRIIFAASPDQSYVLYYGNSQARAPSYDLERVFPYLITEDLPAAQLGEQTVNPLFALPAAPSEPLTERLPWLLPSAVALGSLLIGLFLANLFRQIKKSLPPPP